MKKHNITGHKPVYTIARYKPTGPVGLKILGYSTTDNAFYSFVTGKRKWENNILVAECLNNYPFGLRDTHSAPVEKCTCGIYGASEWRMIVPYAINSESYSRLRPVLVLIEASGKVIEHEYGFRCEQAKVIAIVADEKLDSLGLYYPWEECLPFVTLKEAKKLVGKRRFALRRIVQKLHNAFLTVWPEYPYIDTVQVLIVLMVIVLLYWVWSVTQIVPG